MKKYIFTDEHYKPICIAYYLDDATAELEAERLVAEMRIVVHVVKDIATVMPK